MGTNYYLRLPDMCRERCDRWIHLGKSSAGWAFVFQASDGITDYTQWVTQLGRGEIYDEYGRQVPAHALIELIDKKRIYPADTGTLGRTDADGNMFLLVDFS